MFIKADVGDTIKFSSFVFTNKSGGTGMSDWKYNKNFHGTARAKIEKMWYDFETGWRFIGKAISKDLVNYLKQNASPEDQRVFVSEFDLV